MREVFLRHVPVTSNFGHKTHSRMVILQKRFSFLGFFFVQKMVRRKSDQYRRIFAEFSLTFQFIQEIYGKPVGIAGKLPCRNEDYQFFLWINTYLFEKYFARRTSSVKIIIILRNSAHKNIFSGHLIMADDFVFYDIIKYDHFVRQQTQNAPRRDLVP